MVHELSTLLVQNSEKGPALNEGGLAAELEIQSGTQNLDFIEARGGTLMQRKVLQVGNITLLTGGFGGWRPAAVSRMLSSASHFRDWIAG
jgi:hypothetical protein